jgi:CheY-like chemotaxis protein
MHVNLPAVEIRISPHCASAEKVEYLRRQLSRLGIAEMRRLMPIILIVDDDSTIRLLIRETLAVHPLLSFVEAQDGEQALDLATAISPDLILLDVILPKLDGISVCKIIKNAPGMKPTYIALVTGLDKPQHFVNGVMAGADDYLTKPFEETDLWEVVARALHIAQPVQ